MDRAAPIIGDTILKTAAIVMRKKLQAAVTDAPLPGAESTR